MSFKTHRDMAKVSRETALKRARGGQVSSETQMMAEEKPSMNKERKRGGAVAVEGKDKPIRRADGGKVGKGKATTVNVVVAGGGGQPQPVPVPRPVPVPVGAPPGAMPQHPPMMPPPGAGMPPGSAPGVVPPGGMPHRRGGAVARKQGGAVKMTGGAHGAEGRLDKIRMVEE